MKPFFKRSPIKSPMATNLGRRNFAIHAELVQSRAGDFEPSGGLGDAHYIFYDSFFQVVNLLTEFQLFSVVIREYSIPDCLGQLSLTTLSLRSITDMETERPAKARAAFLAPQVEPFVGVQEVRRGGHDRRRAPWRRGAQLSEMRQALGRCRALLSALRFGVAVCVTG